MTETIPSNILYPWLLILRLPQVIMENHVHSSKLAKLEGILLTLVQNKKYSFATDPY